MLKGIIQTAKGEFRRFFLNSKLIILVFAIIFVCETLLVDICNLSAFSGMKLSFLEPYLMVSSLDTYSIVIPLVFLVLVAGFPSRESYNYFFMVRSSKVQWLIGEVLFLVVSAVSYMFVFMGSLLIYMYKHIEWTNSWSSYMLDFRASFPNEFMMNSDFFLGADMMTHGSPVTIFFHSVALMTCLLVMLALLQITFSLLKKRFIGVLASIGITLLSGLLIYSNGSMKWLFPMTHTNIAVHFNGFQAAANFSIEMSYVYFGVCIAVLLVADFIILRKMCMEAER